MTPERIAEFRRYAARVAAQQTELARVAAQQTEQLALVGPMWNEDVLELLDEIERLQAELDERTAERDRARNIAAAAIEAGD